MPWEESKTDAKRFKRCAGAEEAVMVRPVVSERLGPSGPAKNGCPPAFRTRCDSVADFR